MMHYRVLNGSFLLACASYMTTATSIWAPIRTDDAAWQSACGHVKRVGAVCVTAQGHRAEYHVQSNAQQNVVFSGDSRHFMAYCPNTDKKENPYTITYGSGTGVSSYHIYGRASGEQCCSVHYTPANGGFVPIDCVAPSIISGATFPDDNDAVENHSVHHAYPKNPHDGKRSTD